MSRSQLERQMKGPQLMSKLQTPEHKKKRSILRIAGPLTLIVGAIFMIVALVDFFSSFGGFGPPKLFWCFFVGGPIVFVGIVMCQFAFMGAVARYMAAEHVPVATDTINDLAEGTQDAVKTVARSVTEGIVEGVNGTQDDDDTYASDD